MGSTWQLYYRRTLVVVGLVATFLTVSSLLLGGGVSPAYAQDPTPTPTPGGGWPGILPDLPTPQEMVQEILAFIGDAIINALVGWLADLGDSVVNWAAANWSLSNADGLLGGIVRDLFQFSLTVAGGFIVVAVTLTFVQQWLVRLFPGVVRSLTLAQIFGRVFLVALFVNDYARYGLAWLMETTNAMAMGFLVGAGGPGGVPPDWSWLPNLIQQVLLNPAAIQFFGLGLLMVIVCFVGLIVVIFIKHMAAVLIIAALPLAATAWLFSFTESVWGQYWWLTIKLAVLPIILAFFIRVIVTIMATIMASNFIVGALLMVIAQFVGLWVMVKFLTVSLGAVMPTASRLLMVAGGAAMTASGNPMGMAMIAGGLGSGRATEVSRASYAAREISSMMGEGE